MAVPTSLPLTQSVDAPLSARASVTQDHSDSTSRIPHRRASAPAALLSLKAAVQAAKQGTKDSDERRAAKAERGKLGFSYTP